MEGGGGSPSGWGGQQNAKEGAVSGTSGLAEAVATTVAVFWEERGAQRPHLAVPVLHQQDQVLQLGWPRVHEAPPQLREAGCVLPVPAAAVQESPVDLGVRFGAGTELP